MIRNDRKLKEERPGAGHFPVLGLVLSGLLVISVPGMSAAGPATLGNIVTVAGHLADIALDEKRGVVYAANYTTNRVEVISIAGQLVMDPITVPLQPSSLAISPDGKYLVIGHYTAPFASEGLTIIDLDTRTQRNLKFGGTSVLSVAFGSSAQALVLLTDQVRLVDPFNLTSTVINPAILESPMNLNVPWATFPPQILKAAAGVSGDGKVIYLLVNASPSLSYIARYEVDTGKLTSTAVGTYPTLGPLVVSVDRTGSNFMAGWLLGNRDFLGMTEFPYSSGQVNVGGHAFDWKSNRIYAQVPQSAVDAPLLHVADSDNLTIREVFRLRENLAGKALLGSGSMYAISDSGITILPLDPLAGRETSTHRVQAVQEDLLFESDGFSPDLKTAYLDLFDPGGGSTDFSLSASAQGVTLSPISGSTPARVRVVVDPTKFQMSKGTTISAVQISSRQAVNVAVPVRIIVNTRDLDQQGVLHNVPGTLVDIVADPNRDRIYVIRQDRNCVLVIDASTFEQIGVLRTGNTPVQAVIHDGNYLLVTNNHSQLINVFDLNTLGVLDPVLLSGQYASSIAIAITPIGMNAGRIPHILFTTRNPKAPAMAELANMADGVVDEVDFARRKTGPATTRIYIDTVYKGSVLSSSPTQERVFMAMPNGTRALYDAVQGTFISSRNDVAALSGAYAALSDDLFFAGNHVFNTAMVRIADIPTGTYTTSGVIPLDGKAFVSSTQDRTSGGVVEQFSMKGFDSISRRSTAEAAGTEGLVAPKTAFQIGQTFLPFTRQLAALSNGDGVVQISSSGLTLLPWPTDTLPPLPVVRTITNSADSSARVAAGGLISIWGSDLGGQSTAAQNVPLPKVLGGVGVYANAVPLPLVFASSSQINAQLPFDIAATANIVVVNANGRNAPFALPIQPVAPAVFQMGNGSPVIIRAVDGKLVTDATPIHLDQTISIFMTGMGPVTPAINAGEAAPSKPLAATKLTPVITIGGSTIYTLFSGLAPGMVGVYQIDAKLPFRNFPTGSNLPLTITQGGISTTVKVRVQE